MKKAKMAVLSIAAVIILTGGFLILFNSFNPNARDNSNVNSQAVAQTEQEQGEPSAPENFSNKNTNANNVGRQSASIGDGSGIGIKVGYSPAKKKGLSLHIDFGDGTFKDFSASFKENYSVFDLLKEASENLAIPIKTKTYDVGVFVEAINGIEGGKDNKYWLYYVNGELPMVAADKNYLKVSDKVEFKFEKSQF